MLPIEVTPSPKEDTPPVLEPKSKDEKGDEVQLEPTQDEMERERLMSKAEQVSLVAVTNSLQLL